VWGAVIFDHEIGAVGSAYPSRQMGAHQKIRSAPRLFFAGSKFVKICHSFFRFQGMLTIRTNSSATQIVCKTNCFPVNVAWHDEERSVGISRKSEKTASAVRRKHQREHNGKKDG
jgi:hypothetical protein